MTNGSDRWVKQLKIDRRKMTICIAGGAAYNSDDRCIILCTDWLVSGAVGGSEVMLKQKLLPKGFFCLTSGEEGHMLELTRVLKPKIRNIQAPFFEDSVLTAVKDALFDRKKEIADDYIKSRFAMSYQDFYQTGAKNMPPDLFRETMAHINRLDIKTDFVVAGFTDKFGIIIEASADGEASIREEFATVGSGSHLATASLLHRQYTDVNPVPLCLYEIYEAKKYSERTPTVGKRTSLSILTPGGMLRRVNHEGLLALEGYFEKYGPQKVPYEFSFDNKLFAEPMDLGD